MHFLTDGKILETVRKLVQDDGELLAAVAFWGRGSGQETGITERAGPTRILCDLLSGSCNPAEIRHLMDKGVEVKHRPQLHAKVWMNGDQVIVGSANASMNGLGFETSGPNIEAAAQLSNKRLAEKVQEWFCAQWKLAQCVDEALLQTAEERWNQTQNMEGRIMRCLITAYENTDLSTEARDRFDQIASNHYSENELAEIRADAEEHSTEPADMTCYELRPDHALPPIGTVYMDYDCASSGGNFTFNGFWEVIHNEPVPANGHTLCFLRKRQGRTFRAPPGCGGRTGIETMINCYLRERQQDSVELPFRDFYVLQQQQHCRDPEQRCVECPIHMAD